LPPLKPGCSSPTSAFSPGGLQGTMSIKFFLSQALTRRLFRFLRL
jgi:hypothetical protein